MRKGITITDLSFYIPTFLDFSFYKPTFLELLFDIFLNFYFICPGTFLELSFIIHKLNLHTISREHLRLILQSMIFTSSALYDKLKRALVYIMTSDMEQYNHNKCPVFLLSKAENKHDNIHCNRYDIYTYTHTSQSKSLTF